MRYRNLKKSLENLMKDRRWSLYRLSKEIPNTTYHTLRNITLQTTEDVQEDTIKAIEEGLGVRIDDQGNFHPVNNEEDLKAVEFLRDDPDFKEEDIQFVMDQLAIYSPGERESLFKILDLIRETPADQRSEIMQAIYSIVKASRGK